MLYLVQQGLQDVPVLYLSRYINRNKADYYRLLQSVREYPENGGQWDGVAPLGRTHYCSVKGVKNQSKKRRISAGISSTNSGVG